MAQNDTAIKVDNLVKTFKIPVEAHSGIKQKIINQIKGRSGYRDFTPLKGVSFEIKKGEFFGIVGRNGSGKSTLLKTIAGIYHPDDGGVVVNGVLVPFIELGVGFNPELTGRENVFLNGALLGFSRQEVELMYDEIVDFAELHEFMEEKLKNYSSGMQVRLAFSIAIRAKGDILLLDEVLAVGDSAFQQKCYNYFELLKEQKKTVVLVSHSMNSVEQFCDRALLLEKGEIYQVGSSEVVANSYERLFLAELRQGRIEPSGDQSFENVELSAEIIQNRNPQEDIEAGKDFQVKITAKSKIDIARANIVINIKNSNHDILCAVGTEQFMPELSLRKGKELTVMVDVQNIFTDDTYTLNIGIDKVNEVSRELIEKRPNAAVFNVIGTKYHRASLTHPDIKITVN